MWKHSVLLFFAFACVAATPSFGNGPPVTLWQRIESHPQGVFPAPFHSPGIQATTAAAFDSNGNGAAELFIGSRLGAPSVQRYQYAGGQWIHEVIDNDVLRIEAGNAYYDIDGDGHPDLVFGRDGSGNEIWWWRNPGPRGGPWERRLITDVGPQKHHDIIFGDFTGDGRTELVAWGQRDHALQLFTIPDDPLRAGNWPFTVIYEFAPEAGDHEGFAAADINGDGVLNIVGAGRWWKYAGDGEFEVEVIDSAMSFTRAGIGRFKPGGRPNPVFVPGDSSGPLNWYEWTGDRWKAHNLLPHVIHGHSLWVGDINGNGHDDIIVGEMAAVTHQLINPQAKIWVFYGDGKGGFTRQLVSQGQGVHELQVADFTGDGRMDIMAKAFVHNAPKVVFFRNTGTAASPVRIDRWQPHLIDPGDDSRLVTIRHADIDGDGHPDLVAGAHWYRNPGTGDLGNRWEKRAIGNGFNNLAVIADFTGNGAPDLLGTDGTPRGGQFVLAINEGGRFRLRTDLPASEGDFLQGVAVGRFHARDDPYVVLSWHGVADRLEALRYPHGEGAAGPWRLEKLHEFTRDEEITAVDVDGDGQVDLVLGDHWLRNTGDGWDPRPRRIGMWWDFNLHPRAQPDRHRVVDMNNNGWPDVVVGFERGEEIVWFENPGRPGVVWRRHLIGRVPGQGFSLDVGDPDMDGDFDVLVGEHRNREAGNRILLFENLDGRGTEWRMHVIHQGPPEAITGHRPDGAPIFGNPRRDDIDHHVGTQFADLNGNGLLDIYSIGWYHPKVWVFENKAGTALRAVMTKSE